MLCRYDFRPLGRTYAGLAHVCARGRIEAQVCLLAFLLLPVLASCLVDVGAKKNPKDSPPTIIITKRLHTTCTRTQAIDSVCMCTLGLSPSCVRPFYGVVLAPSTHAKEHTLGHYRPLLLLSFGFSGYFCPVAWSDCKVLYHQTTRPACVRRRASALHGVQPRRAFNHPVRCPFLTLLPPFFLPPFPPTGTLLFACCLFSRPTP